MTDKNFLYCFDPNTLLPADPKLAEKYREDEAYFDTLAIMASLIRDKESECSIYRGEDYSEPLQEFLSCSSECGTRYLYAVFEDTALQSEMLKRAAVIHTMTPDGIFERLDLEKITKRAVFYRGIVHELDYR